MWTKRAITSSTASRRSLRATISSPPASLMEAYSVEDEGVGVQFCVYCYNVQPGVVIDYATGDSRLASDAD